MLYKQILSVLAIGLTLYAFVPYIFSILNGKIKPHVFSWLIWGSTTFVVFFAQLKDGAGVGAWPGAVSSTITVFIAILAYTKQADNSITRTDWYFFLTALSSLPLWYFTSDPVWAVIILTIVDLLGFGPTVRKGYHYPHSESVLFFSIFALRNVLIIMALENYTTTTMLFPISIAVSCIAFNLMLLYRRRVLLALAD